MKQITEEKSQLRNQIRAARKQLDRTFLLEQSEALCCRLLELPELQRAKTVFCYVSCGGEVETHRLIDTLLAQGKQVVVPRCRAKGIMDLVPIVSLAELKPSRMGILEPDAEAACVEPCEIEFAVVPAVACGEDGSRLGQGGGYYDRFLETADCDFAAICLENFVFPTLPCEPHDRFMNIIVTQQRVLRFEEI